MKLWIGYYNSIYFSFEELKIKLFEFRIKNATKKPAFDHWWQTETGWPITNTCVGLLDESSIENIPSGVSGKPVPGYDGIKSIVIRSNIK
jgi:propionyl-CoA synthetase